MVEVDEIQRTEFYLLLALQDGFDTFALFGRNERHGILRTQAQMAGTVVRRQPEFDLGPIGGVPPMTRQNETLLMPGQMPALESSSIAWILVGEPVPCSVDCPTVERWQSVHSVGPDHSLLSSYRLLTP